MSDATSSDDLRHRHAPVDLSPEQFRVLGHRLVDQIAEFLASLPQRPVTPGESPAEVRRILGGDDPLPRKGSDAGEILDQTTRLLMEHSLLDSHPRFLGYVIGCPTPIGALGDLLAAAVNPNSGGWVLSPMASEIERQTVRWIAEMLDYPVDCGGLLVSGGNMANFVGFLAGRKAKAPWDVRTQGMGQDRTLLIYASHETHTWIHKACDLFGLGTDSIRWVPSDRQYRISTDSLREMLQTDKQQGLTPIMVIGSAGTVSTGAVDPLPELAAIAREYDLWFHVDGAYGGLAAMLPDASPDLKALRLADSIAVDPHKWLYAPLEAGCALVRTPQHLLDAFSYRPLYYHLDTEAVNYYEYGMQNSRGFRALKVWLAIRQIGREGYERLIGQDIRLNQALYQLISTHSELESQTGDLSITTFRYVPVELKARSERDEQYLNELNTEILDRLQKSGELFVSNAVLDGRYLLRSCVVNFRTTLADIEAIPEIVVRIGRSVHAEMRGGQAT